MGWGCLPTLDISTKGPSYIGGQWRKDPLHLWSREKEPLTLVNCERRIPLQWSPVKEDSLLTLVTSESRATLHWSPVKEGPPYNGPLLIWPPVK